MGKSFLCQISSAASVLTSDHTQIWICGNLHKSCTCVNHSNSVQFSSCCRHRPTSKNSVKLNRKTICSEKLKLISRPQNYNEACAKEIKSSRISCVYTTVWRKQLKSWNETSKRSLLTIIQLIFKSIGRPTKQQLIEYFAANSEAWSRKESFSFFFAIGVEMRNAFNTRHTWRRWCKYLLYCMLDCPSRIGNFFRPRPILSIFDTTNFSHDFCVAYLLITQQSSSCAYLGILAHHLGGLSLLLNYKKASRPFSATTLLLHAIDSDDQLYHNYTQRLTQARMLFKLKKTPRWENMQWKS